MKKTLFLSFLYFTFQNTMCAKEYTKIEDVISSHVVKTSFSYLSGPFHKSINTIVTNTSNKPVSVVVNPGLLLESENSGWQNHLITKRDTFTVKPMETKTIALSGMCCERYDGCPRPLSRFTLVPNYREDLISLCTLIDSMKLCGYEAQTAIWNLADRSSANAIIGSDSATVMQLRYFVGGMLKQKVEVYHDDIYVSRPRQRPTIAFQNTGILQLDSVTTNDVFVIELYDADSDTRLNIVSCDKIFIQKKEVSLFMSNIKLNNLQANRNYIVRLKKNGTVNREWLYAIA